MNLLDPPAEGLVSAWTWLFATWFGTGLVDPLRAGLAVFTCLPLLLFLKRYNAAVVATCGLAILAIGVYVAFMLELASGIKDDRRIVIDEVGAFIVGVSLILRFAGAPLLALYAVVFLAVDKLKFWPLSRIEQLPGGWGVMADDLAAALLVASVFLIILRARRSNA